MNYIELIGILATIFVMVSMSCKTSSYKSASIMRLTNMIGSVLFVIYGALLPAISTAIMNFILIFINLYHLIKLNKNKGIC